MEFIINFVILWICYSVAFALMYVIFTHQISISIIFCLIGHHFKFSTILKCHIHLSWSLFWVFWGNGHWDRMWNIKTLKHIMIEITTSASMCNNDIFFQYAKSRRIVRKSATKMGTPNPECTPFIRTMTAPRTKSTATWTLTVGDGR